MKKLKLLQSFRAIAPVMILLLHASHLFEVNFMYMLDIEKTGGVDLFFVMSGFLLYYIYQRKFGVQGETKRFLIKRVSRIYPLVWILTIFFFIVSAMLGTIFPTWTSYSWNMLLDSMLILPNTEHILDTTWSLSHIIFFYGIIALIIWKPVLRIPFLIITLFCSILFLMPSELEMGWLGLVLNLYNLEFLLGCLAAQIVLKKRLAGGYAFLIAGISGFMFTGYYMMDGEWEFIPLEVLFGVSSFFLILGGAALDRNKDIRIPKLFQVLEKSSFAIYLIHYPLLLIFIYFYDLHGVDEYVSSTFVFTASVMITIAICIGAHYWVERPLDQMVQRWIRPKLDKVDSN
ncbi:acyltransferase [Hazenella sp. IB182357]|uniref:Acyltransferase n=1 Tax=Polycladospora coralii TaxID=2771432 RepID=A0A926RT76_9BACL|nr:acyltransferase [Polycladospora coralii]MBD1370982.1 acyltransferase [Polycladospora coralii]